MVCEYQQHQYLVLVYTCVCVEGGGGGHKVMFLLFYLLRFLMFSEILFPFLS